MNALPEENPVDHLAVNFRDNLDRCLRVRLVEELFIEDDTLSFSRDHQPCKSWNPRRLIDGAESRVGLLRAGAEPGESLQFLSIYDRRELIDPLKEPRFVGIVDGGGMVFLEGADIGVGRRWVVYPMDATGQILS